MRIFLAIISCFAFLITYGGKQDGLPVISHRILSDTNDVNVPADSTLITGHVLHVKEPVAGALIANCTSQTRSKTDEKGYFEIMLSSSDSCLYMFKAYYEEIVVNKLNLIGGHRIQMEFYASDKFPVTEVDKPVVYVYSPEEQVFSMKLDPKSELTFTYPEYDNGWIFTADNSGCISANGQQYPYLFWEGETRDLTFVQEQDWLENAAQIRTDTCIQFLERVLEAYGLNSTEQTDFITFWSPRLQANNFATIQFLSNEKYSNQIAGLKMSPAAESSIRVFMLFQSSEYYNPLIKTFEPTPSTFERRGITLVEWGGAELPNHIKL